MKLFSDSWLVVIYDTSQTDEELREYILSLKNVKYAVFQRQKINGKEHINLFICFTRLRKFLTIKRYFPNSRIEWTINDIALNKMYIEKDKISRVVEVKKNNSKAVT